MKCCSDAPLRAEKSPASIVSIVVRWTRQLQTWEPISSEIVAFSELLDDLVGCIFHRIFHCRLKNIILLMKLSQHYPNDKESDYHSFFELFWPFEEDFSEAGVFLKYFLNRY